MYIYCMYSAKHMYVVCVYVYRECKASTKRFLCAHKYLLGWQRAWSLWSPLLLRPMHYRKKSQETNNRHSRSRPSVSLIIQVSPRKLLPTKPTTRTTANCAPCTLHIAHLCILHCGTYTYRRSSVDISHLSFFKSMTLSLGAFSIVNIGSAFFSLLPPFHPW